jgi:hypothetical protein
MKKDKRVSSFFKANSSEYSIRYNPCIEKFVAHLKVKGVDLYVASALDIPVDPGQFHTCRGYRF